MKLRIFSLRDQKINAFMSPMAMQTPGQVVRMLQDEMAKGDNMIGMHAEDFELFEVGDFDTETGRLTGREAPQQVMLLSDLKPKV